MIDTRQLELAMLRKVKDEIARNRKSLDAISSDKIFELIDCFGFGRFGVEAWLVSSCSYLNGDRPIDRILVNYPEVIAAARLQREPIKHG